MPPAGRRCRGRRRAPRASPWRLRPAVAAPPARRCTRVRRPLRLRLRGDGFSSRGGIIRPRLDTALRSTYHRPDNWLSGREEFLMTRTHKLINLTGIVMPFVGLILAIVLLWHRFV